MNRFCYWYSNWWQSRRTLSTPPWTSREYDSTNYWGGLRTFITNLTYAARVLQDKEMAYEVAEKALEDRSREGELPMLFKLILTYCFLK